MKFKVNPEIFQKFPGVRIGVLALLGIDNTKGKEQIAQLLREEEKKQNFLLQNVDFATLPETAGWRVIYEQFGSRPRDFRSSVEALLRRIRTGNPLPSINPLVDLYNHLSIHYYVPAGAEDLDKVVGDIELTFAKGDEQGRYLGSEEIETCYPGEVIYKDEMGFICRRWNWREAERTKIDLETKNVVLVLESLATVSNEKFSSALREAESLVKEFLGGQIVLKVLTEKDCVLDLDFKTGDRAEETAQAFVKPTLLKKDRPSVGEEKSSEKKVLASILVDKNNFSYKLREGIYKAVSEIFEKEAVSFEEVTVEHPAGMEHGDYSTNFAMAKFVQFKVQSLDSARDKSSKLNNPKEIADTIVKKWQEIGFPDFVEKVEVAGPGFINIWLKFESLSNHLVKLLNEGFTREGFGGFEGVEGRKTMVIDYSAPNIAKPFGIGHLRSTNIGQAIYNIYKFLGWKTVGDNHLGDWGTQFGKLIFQIELKVKSSKLKVGRKEFLKNLTIEELEKLYVEFHKEAETKPEMEEEARFWFKKLEDGDSEAKKIWQACVDISLKEFERIYQLLGVKIDYAYGESFYQDKMGEVLRDCEQKGILKESQGAKVIELSGEKVPAMLIKSDGATTYILRDLATVKFRKKTWNPDLYIYEVGADQSFHFRQLFKLCALLGYGQLNMFVHVPHGLIRWKSGKFSTRKGMTIHLEEVLNEAIGRAEKLCETAGVAKDLSSGERVRVAKAIGIGAIKYNDLKQNPTTDIIFDWGQMLTLSGNSGPYLQYTYARIKSVERKAKSEKRRLEKENVFNNETMKQLNNEEIALLRTIYKFPEEVTEAAQTYSPNLLCNFLFDLCQKFNLFYDKHRILVQKSKVKSQNHNLKVKSDGELTEEQSQFRLLLTAAVGQVLKNGLTLLGIESLERM